MSEGDVAGVDEGGFKNPAAVGHLANISFDMNMEPFWYHFRDVIGAEEDESIRR